MPEMGHKRLEFLFGIFNHTLQAIQPSELTDLVAGAASLSDDALEVLNLRLSTAEGTEPLLGELTGTLVLGVAEQLNDAALVGSKAVVRKKYVSIRFSQDDISTDAPGNSRSSQKPDQALGSSTPNGDCNILSKRGHVVRVTPF